MAMARFSLFLVLGILLVTDVSCVDPPTVAPVSNGNDSPISQPPIQNVQAPAISPSSVLSSPPSPAPTEYVSSKNISSSSSPSPSPSVSPSPAPESDTGRGSGHVTKKSSPPSSSSSSSGKKAGIAVGVLIGAALVGLGGFVYKKRQNNIRRAQFGSSSSYA